MAPTSVEPGAREPASLRGSYRHFVPITPRWNDIDAFGHVNNAEYYAFFDTAVMHVMVHSRIVDIAGGPIATLVAETGCRFHREVRFQDSIQVGLGVARLGTTSVCYHVGIFTNDAPDAAADGHFVHVFVDRSSKRPTAIPEAARSRLQTVFALS